MKKRWRSKRSKSDGPAFPSGRTISSWPGGPPYWQGGPASPNQSGETAASSDRTGGSASSASADLDREGGDERMDHWKKGGDGSPSPGKEAAFRPKRRLIMEKQRVSDRGVGDGRMQIPTPGVVTAIRPGVSCVWIPRRLMSEFNGNARAALKAYNEEEGNKLAALKGTEEESIKQNDDAILKKGCLDDADVLMEQSSLIASCSSSRSGDEQSCSQDCGKIAQDEDEGGHSGKKTGVDAIEEHKQEEGSASGHLTVDRKLAELSDENLKLEYPASKLYDNGFFEYYEESLEWYFDPERCTSARFDNYQRLVLHGYRGYLDWDFYSSILNTYEEDVAYVQYFEEVANKTKWIEDYLGDSKIEWERIRSLALMQALEIAAGFPNVSPLLVTYGFQEYINSIKRGCYSKGLDGLYFEIWKRVAKEKTSDDKARQLIREVIRGSVSKPLYYLDYARRKLDIADDIELIPKERRRVVAPQGKEDKGEAKVQMDD
nr:unnamed protein product [Digitaria exilis]